MEKKNLFTKEISKSRSLSQHQYRPTSASRRINGGTHHLPGFLSKSYRKRISPNVSDWPRSLPTSSLGPPSNSGGTGSSVSLTVTITAPPTPSSPESTAQSSPLGVGGHEHQLGADVSEPAAAAEQNPPVVSVSGFRAVVSKRPCSVENSLALSPAFLWQLQSYVNYAGASHFRNFLPALPPSYSQNLQLGGREQPRSALLHRSQERCHASLTQLLFNRPSLP